MARRRGFFAELQYQQQLAEKKQLQAQRAQSRAYAAAVREEEQARKRAERAAAQLFRATAAQQREAEREAKRLHEEARLAEVESLNARLCETLDEIDSLLATTLDTDDFVDLEELRVIAEHPPFGRPDLEIPTPLPNLAVPPKEPIYVPPTAPTGLAGMLNKKKHAEAVAAAEAAYARSHEEWRAEAAAVPERQQQQMQSRVVAEQARNQELEHERAQYLRECDERDEEAAQANSALDDLKQRLADGDGGAIQEYVAIVLSNSIYPEAFPVQHEFEFDLELKELVLAAAIPPPSAVPTVRIYRYVKARDEITETSLSKRDLKQRYNRAAYQVALRSLHEIFEADRTGHVKTIALTVATDAIDPATGRVKRTNLVAVGAERESFLSFDLHNIVPEATLDHLGASVSKSPYDLVDIDPTSGVRVSDR